MAKLFKKVLIVIFLTLYLIKPVFSQGAEYKSPNDMLYSQEYFDYLIECASLARLEQEEEKKKNKQQENEIKLVEDEEYDLDDELTLVDSDAFKLKIESFDVASYKETIKKEDSKISVKINNKVSITHDTSKFKNKYNSNDLRFMTGVEVAPFSKLKIASGLETNYRGKDQNPISKKLYITPTLNINDKLSISFINKMNTLSKSTDHDISFNISPFKSKAADFKVYAGVTRNTDGNTSESINFSTNFYF